MSDLSIKSLAQIVNGNHRSASVFEKYHLDFCCKGKRSLQQACDESQVPVEQIIAELDNLSNSDSIKPDINQLSLSKLADTIVLTHHAYVKKEMPAIFEYLEKVAFKHGKRHPELFKVFQTFAAMQEEMTQHMEKEEQILFPRIKSLEKTPTEKQQPYADFSSLQLPIAMMEEEHDHAGRMLDEIRQLTDDYTPPVDACTTYRLGLASLQAFEIDLHQHVHLENNVLFPKALNLFQMLNKVALN